MTTIQNFADFLLKVVSYAENQDDLVKQMSIRQFLSGAINYKKFVEAVEKYASAHREHNDDMTYLEDYAKFVKDSKLTEDSLTQLKELLTQAITPVKLDKIEGDTVIEVTGNNIVLSKVIEQVEADPGFAKGTVKEVRVVARAIVHADVNLSQNKWHGKNFVVWTDELNVVKENCTWNFSGFDKESTFAAENAGMDENGDGKDGEDGKPGESGGNVVIKAENVNRGVQLKIISNGGKGGKGQDGGNGRRGVNGRNVTKSDLDEIPSSADTSYNGGESSYKSADEVIYNKRGSENPFVKKYDGGRWGNSYIKAKLANGFEVTYINFQLIKCLTLVRGSEGTFGGKGGKHGLGGEGGFPGTINLDVPKDARIQTENFKGNAGREGDGGYFGQNGIKGADMARLSYVKDNSFLAILYGIFSVGIHSLVNYVKSDITGDVITKYYGEGGNQYLELFNTSYDNEEAVWCLHTNNHVIIDNAGRRPNEAVKVYQQRNSAKQIRERQKHAQAVRQRAINVTELALRYKSSFAKVQFSVFAIKEVTVQVKQTVKQKVEQEIKVSRIVSSEIKEPSGRKPKVLETNDTDTVRVNQEFEVNDLSNVINSKYEALEKIGLEELKLPILDINEIITVPEKCEKFLRRKRDTHVASNEILLELNKDVKGRENYITELKLNKNNINDSIIREFVKEINDDGDHSNVQEFTRGYLSNYESFSKHQLNERLRIVGKYDENLSSSESFKEHINVRAELETLNKMRFADWNLIRKKDIVWNALIAHVNTCKPDCPTFMELVAKQHTVNIRMYEEKEANNDFLLKSSYNSRSNHVMYVVKNDTKIKELELDEERYRFEQQQEFTQDKYRKILNEIEKFKSPVEIESYVKLKIFDIDNENHYLFEVSPLYNFVTSGDISFLVKTFIKNSVSKEAKDFEQKMDTIMRLGAASTVHYMADRIRNSENPNVTIRDIMLVVNTVLQLANENRKFAIIDWILATRKPDMWTIHIALLRLEKYFQVKLNHNQHVKWEGYLKQVTNKNIFTLFCLKLTTTEKGALDLDKMDMMLNLLSVSEPDIASISGLKLQEWTYVLKEFYWKYMLKETLKWDSNDKYMQKAVHLLLKIENKYQFGTTKAFVESFAKGNITEESDKVVFIEILQKFADEAWNITNDVILNVQSSEQVSEWKSSIVNMMPKANHIRKADEILEIIKHQLNMENSSVNPLLKNAQKKILDQMSVVKKSLDNINEFSKQIIKYTSDVLKNQSKSEKNPEKLLAMIDQAVFLWSTKRESGKGFRLRDTQKLSALTAINNSKILLQVSTGEGKSLIVAAVAIIRVLNGQQVDVITTSSVLAERDVHELKSLYEMFNITVGHNTADDSTLRQAAYKSHVVYGDLSSFQRDFLLDQFYNKGVRGDRKFSSVIVDEVDSMLLDKGNSTLYLSHEIPELDKLESIYMQIWTRVIIGKTTNKGKKSFVGH